MTQVYTKKFPYMKKLFVSHGLTTADIWDLFDKDAGRSVAEGRPLESIPYPTLYTWGAKCRGEVAVGWGIPKWAEARAKRVLHHYSETTPSLFDTPAVTVTVSPDNQESPYPGKTGDIIPTPQLDTVGVEQPSPAAGSFSLVAKDGSDLNLNDVVALLKSVTGKTIKSINVEF